MDWMAEVEAAIGSKKQVLFSKDSEFLRDLRLLIGEQTHRTVVLWAFAFAGETVCVLGQKYPGEERPANALKAARLWASGNIKMPQAQREILRCHAMAKELSSPEDIALCHGVGQACSTVHTVGHAIGYPLYELTAIIRRVGVDRCRGPVEARKTEYIEKLCYFRDHAEAYRGGWAAFLLR